MLHNFLATKQNKNDSVPWIDSRPATRAPKINAQMQFESKSTQKKHSLAALLGRDTNNIRKKYSTMPHSVVTSNITHEAIKNTSDSQLKLIQQ